MGRVYLKLFLIFLALFLLCPIATTTSTANEARNAIGISSEICIDSYDQRYQAIYDNIIIWIDNRNGLDSDIYAYDLESKRETRITTNISHRRIYGLDIYNNYIVWSDNRSGNADIYLFDLTSGSETQITTNTSDQMFPSIFNEIIVWVDGWNSSSNIYSYNIRTREELQLTSDNYFRDGPWIWGNKVMWVNDLWGYSTNISIYNLSSRIESNVIFNKQIQQFPSFCRDILIYTRLSWLGGLDVYSYNLRTGEEIQISTDGYNQSNPNIHDNMIVWADDRNGNWDIYSYDLNTHSEKQITSDPQDQIEPQIHSNTITWSDDRNGNWDIFAFLPDTDNDGFSDFDDHFPENPFEHQDLDSDGIGDNLDDDTDGDGYENSIDIFPHNNTEWRDYDRDGIGDNLDEDDDNDGIQDLDDDEPLNPLNSIDDKIDQLHSRITLLESNLTNRINSVEMNIVSKISSMNNTLISDIAENLVQILSRMDDIDLFLEYENRSLSNRIQNLETNLSFDLDTIQEYIGLRFNLLRSYIELIKTTLYQDIVNATNISEIEEALDDLAKLDGIIEDIEIIERNLDVQQANTQTNADNTKTFFIVTIVLMTIYTIILIGLLVYKSGSWQKRREKYYE